MSVLRLPFFSLFVFVLATGFTFYGGWIIKKTENGIKVYTAEVTGSNHKKCKAVTNIKTSVDKLQQYLLDPNNYKDFSSKVEKVTVLKKTSNSVIYYMSVDLPWPVSNRDGVYKIVTEKQLSGEVVLRGFALPNYQAKKDGYVRIKKADSYYSIVKNGNSVDVIYTAYTLPNGSVPAWLNNYYLVDGPIDNFKAMKKALE